MNDSSENTLEGLQCLNGHEQKETNKDGTTSLFTIENPVE